MISQQSSTGVPYWFDPVYSRQLEDLEPRDLGFLIDLFTPPHPIVWTRKDYQKSPARNAIKLLARKLNSSEAVQGNSRLTVPDVPPDGTKFFARNDDLYHAARVALKANELDHSTQTGFGAEWIGASYSSSFWEVIRNDVGVIGRLMARAVQVPQGYATRTIPTMTGDTSWYKVVETTANNATTGLPDSSIPASKLATDKKTPALTKIATRNVFSGELGEDSAADWVSTLRQAFENSGREQLCHLVIDGDTVATSANINNANGSALTNNVFLSVNGFRKSPLITTTSNSRSAAGGFSLEDFLLTAQMLGVSGISASDNTKVSFIVDINTGYKLLRQADSATAAIQVADGTIKKVYGFETMVSAFMHAASAKRMANTIGTIDVTDSSNTTGSILAVRWDRWTFIFKELLTVELDRRPESDSQQAMMSARVGLTQADTEASAITFNVGLL